MSTDKDNEKQVPLSVSLQLLSSLRLSGQHGIQNNRNYNFVDLSVKDDVL